MTPPVAPDVEDLLTHTAWMRALALRLVTDEGVADDVVQGTWVAALQRPPRADRREPWLVGVIRRLAARSHRDRYRRRHREAAVAVSESSASVQLSPEQLVQRAELQQRIAAEVLQLQEPYRTTVLLRYYEDLSVTLISRRMAVPEATVRTRLRRAHDRIRETLSRSSDGGHGPWYALLLPLAATELQPGAATSTAFVSGSTLALGGLIMSKTTLLTAFVVGGLALGLGYYIGVPTPEELSQAPVGVSLDEHEKLQGEKSALETRLAELDAENVELKARQDALVAQVARLEPKEQTPTEVAADPVDPADDLAISFGDLAIPELRDAHWETLALAVQNIDDLVVKIAEGLLEGEQPDAQDQMRVASESKKLQAYAISIIGKLPTNHSGNGEFSHPISIANIASAYLENSELPLSDPQRQTIEKLGDAYNDAFAELSYDDDSFYLEKLIDELELKNTFVNEMYGSLDATQYDTLMRPEVRGRNRLDTLSPGVMLTQSAGPVAAANRTDLRQKLIEQAADQLGIDRQKLEASPVFDTWIEDVDSILEPEKAILHSLFKSEHAAVAGRAQIRAMRDLADELGLSEEDLVRMREMPFLLVPRLTLQESDD